MNILLVSTQDYIHHPVPSRHHYIFEELARTHEVHVPHFHVSEGKERPTRLMVHEATKYPVKSPLLHYTLNAPHHYRVMHEIVREYEIDVVVAAHVLAGSAVIRAAKKNAVPVVYDLKDWFPQSAAAYYDNRILKWSIYRTVWAITKYNLDHSDVITTVSPSLVERLDRCGYPSRLITNGVNTDYFRPLPAKAGKQKLGIDPDTFVIGFVGSIERFFNLDFVIRALPALLDSRDAVKLVIVGGSLFTDYESELKRLVRDLNLTDSVLFTGSVPYESLPEYVAAMDVCLIPYASEIWDNHALPNKFFEYSACGKAILSTPIPDVMQIAQDNYFVYRDREEYLNTIRHIMDNPKEYRLDLSEYSWQRKAREFEAIFEDLTG